MILKKLFFLFLLLLNQKLFSANYSNFKQINLLNLKPFTSDIGGLLGGGINYSARSLGFSGFDISFRSSYQLKPSKKNTILPSERAFGFNYIQIELGMPYRLDGFIRAGGGDEIIVVGGGIKYGLWKVMDELYRVHGILVINSHMANYKDFYAIQYGAQTVFSMNCGNIRPYAAIGFDNTRLVVQNASDTSMIDKEEKVLKDRYTFGFRWKIKWFNIAAAYNILHGRNGIEGAIGLRF